MAKLIKGINDLSTLNPELVKEWHPTKNGELKPTDVTYGSGEKVWWLCNEGHEYQASVYARNKGSKCPYCAGQKVLKGFNDLASQKPELAKEWHPTKNEDLTPDKVPCQYNKNVWWLGKCGHEWFAKVSNRFNGAGCPYCSGRYPIKGVNDLATTNPELASEWHPTKNGNLTPSDVKEHSNKKVWWMCNQGHEWEAMINSRIKRGCPYCGGKAVLTGYNDLATLYPNLAEEWHPTKNHLQPAQVSK